jgi:hypothetical protein
MTPEQRLTLLEELQNSEPATIRRARIGAWASVVLASCITAVLLYVAYSERARVERDVAQKRVELEKLNVQLETTARRLRAWQTVVSEIPKPQLEAGFAKASRNDPNVENILRRVYVQTPPGEEAMKRAKEVQRKLRQDGFVVPGIEVRPESPTQTQVRYYKSAEAPQAWKIVESLHAVGEKAGPPQHLKQFENSTAVRPNHYEVWLGANLSTSPSR